MKEPIERRSVAAQLAERIEREIHAGTWRDELPGKRTLAGRYEVNVKTAAAAVEILERWGRIAPGNIGKKRRILSGTEAGTEAQESTSKRLLIIHQSAGVLNAEDFKLLQRMAEIWGRVHGSTVWAGVDFPRSKSPGRTLETLIARHAAHAMLLHMPAAGWGEAAVKRVPCYQVGGPYTKDTPVSLGACSLPTEIKRMVGHLASKGHRRIPIPTEGLGEPMRLAVIKGLAEGAGGKPEAGTWEDHVPDFPESTPEAWDRYWQKSFDTLRPTAAIVFEDTHLLSLYGYCFTRGIRIPDKLSVMSLNYESRFEWLAPRPTMMRYPAHLAIAHFQQWVDGGLKPSGCRFFELEMIHGGSVAASPG